MTAPLRREHLSPVWHEARRHGVLAVGVLVGVAIACVIVAVITSARQANEFRLTFERQLLVQALASQARQTLGELESVTSPAVTYRYIAAQPNPTWVSERIGARLRDSFGHDAVLVFDASARIVHSSFWPDIDEGAATALIARVRPMFDAVDEAADILSASAFRIAEPVDTRRTGRRAAVMTVLGRLAYVVAIDILPPDLSTTDPRITPAVISVRFLTQQNLADIGAQLHLGNLRITQQPAGANDYAFDLLSAKQHSVARFVWEPSRPGSQIVQTVLPFVVIAVVGFVLLTGVVVRYMGLTRRTIVANERQLRHLAWHDPLCGLPNRALFGERLAAALDRVAKGGPRAAVLYIDLDHFKDVNDTLGHPIGDELLQAVALRLKHTLRPQDLIARLGGDEFAVLTSDAVDVSVLNALAARIIMTLCAPYAIGGQNIVVGASIGIALLDGRIDNAADVMRYADMALYRAKNEGRNRSCIYDTAMDADLTYRKILEGDLRQALEQGTLTVAYQPIVNNSGEHIVGVEALCRWTHPSYGEIPPSQFIPIAEHSGLIVQLGEMVLRQACIDGNQWPDITVAVNVSPLQFRRTDFVETVERILRETAFDANRLELEVTESTLLGHVESVEMAMLRLKVLGARLALDDFGTGYSSLLYLRRFPFDKLKIDSSFVRHIERPSDAAIVHAVVGLGRGLGMKVTAEGIETPEQHLFLRAAGVHSLQGYRFGRPGSAAVISARLADPASFPAPDDKFAIAV